MGVGVEWLRAGPHRAALAGRARPAAESRTVSLATETLAHGQRRTLTATGARSALTYTIDVMHGVGAITMSVASRGPRAPNGVRRPRGDAAAGCDQLERLTLAPAHLRLTQVELLDRTDRRNELVHERRWPPHASEAELRLAGCLFAFEDVLAGNGLILLKHCCCSGSRGRDLEARWTCRGPAWRGARCCMARARLRSRTGGCASRWRRRRLPVRGHPVRRSGGLIPPHLIWPQGCGGIGGLGHGERRSQTATPRALGRPLIAGPYGRGHGRQTPRSSAHDPGSVPANSCCEAKKSWKDSRCSVHLVSFHK